MKFRLYDIDEEYLKAIQDAEKRLKIPNATAREYCDKKKVSNPDSEHFGKWIFPIIPTQLFYYNEAGKVFDCCNDWFIDNLD